MGGSLLNSSRVTEIKGTLRCLSSITVRNSSEIDTTVRMTNTAPRDMQR